MVTEDREKVKQTQRKREEMVCREWKWREPGWSGRKSLDYRVEFAGEVELFRLAGNDDSRMPLWPLASD